MAKIDPIDRVALLEQLAKYRAMPLDGHTFKGGKIHPILQEMRQAAFCDMEQLLRAAPTIDVPPVRRGEWEICWGGVLCCTVCGKSADDFIGGLEGANYIEEPNFCPHCGADMRAVSE